MPPSFLAKVAEVLTQHHTETIRETQLGIAKLISGTDTLYRGEGYYVLNYYVELPPYWGEDAQQVAEYASDIDNVMSNLDVSGFSFFTLLVIVIPLVSRMRRQHQCNRQKKD